MSSCRPGTARPSPMLRTGSRSESHGATLPAVAGLCHSPDHDGSQHEPSAGLSCTADRRSALLDKPAVAPGGLPASAHTSPKTTDATCRTDSADQQPQASRQRELPGNTAANSMRRAGSVGWDWSHHSTAGGRGTLPKIPWLCSRGSLQPPPPGAPSPLKTPPRPVPPRAADRSPFPSPSPAAAPCEISPPDKPPSGSRNAALHQPRSGLHAG